ncbi:MAG: hypothetical protein ACR2IL_11640 [Chitinophagaceae bacterium]
MYALWKRFYRTTTVNPRPAVVDSLLLADRRCLKPTAKFHAGDTLSFRYPAHVSQHRDWMLADVADDTQLSATLIRVVYVIHGQNGLRILLS